MRRKIIFAGLLGAVVLIVWTFVINGVLGFQARIDMRPIAAEREVYEALTTHIVEPGRYICNPQLTPERRFPDEDPVYSVLYSGLGHGSAGGLTLVGLVIFLLAPMIATFLLGQASNRVLSSYSRKLLFFVAIGVLIALIADLSRFGIGGYPLRDAFLLALNRIVAWTLIGLIVAWRVRSPGPSQTAFP